MVATGSVRKNLTGTFRREDYAKWRELLGHRSILLFYGLRRVGKTTMMHQLIDDLLRSGVEPERILYFSFDESPPGDLDAVISSYARSVLKRPLAEARGVYIFFDEVQKARDWENKVKIYYDLYPGIKFVLSGSSSLNLARRSSETLAGRIMRVRVEPLSFREFCRLRGGHDISYDRLRYAGDALEPLLSEYMEKGGFPELVGGESDGFKIREYVRSIVIDRIVARDIPEEFGIRDLDLLRRLTEVLMLNPGMIVNLDKLASSLGGRNRITVSNFLSYMEYSFLIRTVGNYRPGVEAASRKLRKAYPYLPAFHTAMLGGASGAQDQGRILENTMASVLEPEFYYRSGDTEIDFVLREGGGKAIPVEVKSGTYRKQDFARALQRIGSDRGIIVNRERWAVTGTDHMRILECPPAYVMAMDPQRVLGDLAPFHEVGLCSSFRGGGCPWYLAHECRIIIVILRYGACSQTWSSTRKTSNYYC